MPERPLLILPAPGSSARKARKGGGGGQQHLPTRERQAERLAPRFTALQQAFDSRRAGLRAEAAGLAPEEVVVLETVGPVEDFIVAVRKIAGLEWLGEVEEEDIPPDDDFFEADTNGAKTDKPLRGRVFLVFTNQQALRQVLALWDSYTAGGALPHGLAKWAELFAQLHDVRPWGIQDRLLETGVLDDWRERVEHNDEVIPSEIELWFRNDPHQRRVARDRVANLVRELGGNVLQEAVIEEIAYHALLARLPVGAVRPLLEEAGRDAALIQCEQIQFFRASGQMVGIVMDDARTDDTDSSAAKPDLLGDPVVALFDGMPLQNHSHLAGRLVVDDPDGYEAQYPASERRHGTAMASLILHGDLNGRSAPLERRLYIRPILRPDPHDWRQPRCEAVSEGALVVDLLHRAVRRLFEGEGNEAPVAPQVCVVNLSIGIRDRPFDAALSPLAKLLDWLSWKYRVLFIVSAGNYPRVIELDVPRAQAPGLSPHDLQAAVVRAIASDARNRRLLSPAEAVNVLTVGAVHDDGSTGPLPPNGRLPFLSRDFPSVVNAQGMGYRRGIKPDVLMPGGQVLLRESLRQTQNAQFEVVESSRPPGQRVAAPGASPGGLSSTLYIRGTSGATALCSRAASELYDIVEALRAEPGGELIEQIPRSLWLKALLVHGAGWGVAAYALGQILRTQQNNRQFKEYLTRLLGYGTIDVTRVRECTERRVTALGGGFLQRDQGHVHRFPLPPSLSGQIRWRRLTITLAWLTPVNTSHQAWRRADLWFTPPSDPLPVTRQEADWRAVQRGTVQHEILEGDRASAFLDGTSLEIVVGCRAAAGALEDAVPYALATTLEVAEEIGVDIYTEVRTRVQARVRVVPET